MAAIKDVRVRVRLNVLSTLLQHKGDSDQRPGRYGSQRKTIIDVPEVEIPSDELETRLEYAQLVLEHGYKVGLPPPIAVTDEPTITSGHAVAFRAHVNPMGFSTIVRFEYAKTPSVDGWVTCDETPLTGVTNQTVHKDMAGLTHDTVYYCRVRAVNAVATVYGIVKSFKTPVV